MATFSFSSLIQMRTLLTLFTHHARTPFSTASVQVRHRPPPRPACDSEQAEIAASRRASSCPPPSCSPSLPPYRKHTNHKISPSPFHFISSPDTHDTPNTLTTPSIPSPPTPLLQFTLLFVVARIQANSSRPFHHALPRCFLRPHDDGHGHGKLAWGAWTTRGVGGWD
jgi:hypothetical protein